MSAVGDSGPVRTLTPRLAHRSTAFPTVDHGFRMGFIGDQIELGSDVKSSVSTVLETKFGMAYHLFIWHRILDS